jgi:hypothetical protein
MLLDQHHISTLNDINSQYHNLLGNQILPKSEFLYFGGHFWFKMATIANENGRHMVQHVLLPVNIHFRDCCHGNQGANNVNFKPYSGSF